MLNDPEITEAAALIDAARYPVAETESASHARLLAASRAQMEDSGACVLEGFLRPEATAAILAELVPRLPEAYYCRKDHNPYLAPDDPALPASHPRNRPQVSDLGCLADDQIPAASRLRQLYLWPDLRGFIAAVLGVERLYPYEDPLGSLNLNVFQPGQQLGWHFDNADYAITLMLQPARAGGVYEYQPWARSIDDQRYERIGETLDGDRSGLRTLAMGAGALVLFRGRYALHRVTPVEGEDPRLIAVLSYDTEPGVRLTEHNRRLFYGRVA